MIAGLLKRANVDGTSITTIPINVAPSIDPQITGFALDATRIYFAAEVQDSGATVGKIFAVPLAGGAAQVLSSNWDLPVIGNIVVAGQDGSAATNRIERLPLAGGGLTALASALDDVGTMVVTDRVYFTVPKTAQMLFNFAK